MRHYIPKSRSYPLSLHVRHIKTSHEKTLTRLRKYTVSEKCPECLRPITKDVRAHMLLEARKVQDKRNKKINRLLRNRRS